MKIRTTYFYKKDKPLNLFNAWFRCFAFNEGFLIDTVFFYKPEKVEGLIPYETLKETDKIFFVKNNNKKPSKYKTFTGLMTRLYEESKTLYARP